MSLVCANGIVGFALVVASSAGLAACSNAQTVDPCALLSATEAAPFVGPLATPPYRASEGAADVRGDQCMYRGKDGRQITVAPDWSGGGTAVGSPVDKGTWIPTGSLLASTGNRSAQIDVSGASGEEGDAIALARIIMPRFDHPLSYDGGKAVALVPKPQPHPANACDFIPRADVEAAIGRLAATPTSDSPETSCTYRVATAKGERDYVVGFVWQGGQKNYTTLKRQLSTVGFRTDTALAGPWDNASLLHGTQLIAVRHDVFVGLSLQSADYLKARALLAAICSRL